MREHTIESLQTRYDQLEKDTSFEEWRALSQDVLTALVEQQGLVIALQRRAFDSQRGRGEERVVLRTRAEAAFTIVQRLHQLRRKVHALIAQQRRIVASDARLPLARVA